MEHLKERKVLIFHGHTSPPGIVSARKTASALNVIWLQDFSEARRTMSGHRLAGMKRRERQVLTVDKGKSRAEATAPVPPKSSIAESTVMAMDANIVRGLRTSQAFANCETTQGSKDVELFLMGNLLDEQAKRLRETRLALGYGNQAEFCREIGIERNVYNPFEKGRRPITIDAAKAIKSRFRLKLDWIIDGDLEAVSPKLLRKMHRSAA
jgi:hypothetical protein